MATVDFIVRLQNGNTANTLGSSPRWRGDLVLYRVRPHSGLGAAMVPPKFGVITVTGITEDVAADRCQRHYVEYDPEDSTKVLFSVRAGNWVNLDNLSGTVLAQLETVGSIEMSASEFYSRCNNRIAALRQYYGLDPKHSN